jgi:hypothetical protein
MATYFVSGKYQNPQTLEIREINVILGGVTMSPTQGDFIDNARIKLGNYHKFNPDNVFVRVITLLEA